MLLAGCVESMALLGPASSIAKGGNVIQSSVSSVVNYGVKQQTGKTPMQHAFAYAKEQNSEKKNKNGFLKKITLNKKDVVEEKVNKTAVSSKGQAFAKARKEGKKYFIFNGKFYNTKFRSEVAQEETERKNLFFSERKNKNKDLVKSKKSAIELALELQVALNKKSKNKYLD